MQTGTQEDQSVNDVSLVATLGEKRQKLDGVSHLMTFGNENVSAIVKGMGQEMRTMCLYEAQIFSAVEEFETFTLKRLDKLAEEVYKKEADLKNQKETLKQRLMSIISILAK